jgi:hypothetical protein
VVFRTEDVSVDDPLPYEELRQILLDHFGDLEELEILACLHSAELRAGATVSQLVGASRLPESSLQPALDALVARGLVEHSPGSPGVYRFSPPDEETRTQVGRVIAEYRADPLKAIKIMASNAIERVRSAALHTFSEAFRVKRAKSDG